MKYLAAALSIGAIAIAVPVAISAGEMAKPPAPAPVHPVTETLFGRKVTDNYRYMEKLDPETIAWMKAQGAYTRKVLDAIAARAALERKVAAFTASFGFVQEYVSYGGRAFYEYRPPGSDSFDLVVRDAGGTRKIVDISALRKLHGGQPYAINFFLASPDGSKVGVGISEGGSEDAVLFVYDAATGARIAGPIDRAQFGATSWSVDSRRLYFIRLKALGPKDPGTEKYRGASVFSWDLKADPIAILGKAAGHGPRFLPDETPSVAINPGAPVAVAISQNGVQNEQELWLAPAAKLEDPALAWNPFASRADDINSFDQRGDEIFLLSHHNAPTFQVLAVKAGLPISGAKILVPAQPDRVIDAVHAASDALYVLARHGAYSELLRVAAGRSDVETIMLPFKGHISEAFSDPTKPGVSIDLESFVIPPREFTYDPTTRRFRDLKLGKEPLYDFSRYRVSDLEAKARDRVLVPDTLVQPKGAKGPQIVLVEAYGSYGISQLADFTPHAVVFLEAGGSYASCHVRGGGELGDAWRLAGKDANKHNSWQDLIACGEDLIARGVTTKQKLFIFGGSAGGITLGRAFTERPDLFAGVIDAVPAANTLRAEFSPDGPSNIPEFGSVTTAQGFRNLYDMDTIQHIKPGTQYPPVLITTGLNDPRVSPWEPAKLAAALQAAGATNPVLLRVDADAGHGIGSTKTQNDELYADIYAFVFWRAGLPNWQPTALIGK
jgi:prolyl oligopeptidase